jgi:hypothetical protein
MRFSPLHSSFLIAVFFIGIPSSPSLAQSHGEEALPPTAAGVRTSNPPVIDGRLDDPAWDEALVLTGFVQHEPFEGSPVSEPTEVRILFDDEALYVGAWLYDSRPAEIRVGENRRDSNLNDTDAFLILLDTYNDGRNGFVFGTTPAGIEYDGQVSREGEVGGGAVGFRGRQQTGAGAGFNINWDGDWDVAVSRDEDGWYAEFRIPFSTLRYVPGEGRTWGLNLARHIRRLNEQAFWAPVPRQFSFHRLSYAGRLEGLDVPAQRSIQVTPYVLASAGDLHGAASNRYDADVGGELKFTLTPGLAMDLTLNTDFAHVEVDEQQVNLSRFPTFFPEKRPFFLENAGVFQAGTPQEVELFFSRRIGLTRSGEPLPIRGGGRLSGKVGETSVGILNIQTRGLEGLAPSNNFGVVRLERDLPSRSRVGGIFTSRVATDRSGDSNRTLGIDGRLGLGTGLTVDGYLARSWTPDLDGRDHAAAVHAQYTSRDWRTRLGYREVGEDFNPEVGFLSRAGYRFVDTNVTRLIRPESVSWLRELDPHVTYRRWVGYDGFLQTEYLHVDNGFTFQNGAVIATTVNFHAEGLRNPFEISDGVILAPGTYRFVEPFIRANSDRSARLSAGARVTGGTLMSGDRFGLSGDVSAQGMDGALQGSVFYSRDDVRLSEGEFIAELLRFRLAYSFNPSVFVQSLVQYSSQLDSWSGNVRFGWVNRAGTGLYLVLNEVQESPLIGLAPDRALVAKFTHYFSTGL